MTFVRSVRLLPSLTGDIAAGRGYDRQGWPKPETLELTGDIAAGRGYDIMNHTPTEAGAHRRHRSRPRL